MEQYILSLLIFIPVIGAILMLPASKFIKDKSIIKWIALIATGIQLILSIYLYNNFDPTISAHPERYIDGNTNGIYDLGEIFYDKNGKYDEGEKLQIKMEIPCMIKGTNLMI